MDNLRRDADTPDILKYVRNGQLPGYIRMVKDAFLGPFTKIVTRPIKNAHPQRSAYFIKNDESNPWAEAVSNKAPVTLRLALCSMPGSEGPALGMLLSEAIKSATESSETMRPIRVMVDGALKRNMFNAKKNLSEDSEDKAKFFEAHVQTVRSALESAGEKRTDRIAEVTAHNPFDTYFTTLRKVNRMFENIVFCLHHPLPAFYSYKQFAEKGGWDEDMSEEDKNATVQRRMEYALEEMYFMLTGRKWDKGDKTQEIFSWDQRERSETLEKLTAVVDTTVITEAVISNLADVKQEGDLLLPKYKRPSYIFTNVGQLENDGETATVRPVMEKPLSIPSGMEISTSEKVSEKMQQLQETLNPEEKKCVIALMPLYEAVRKAAQEKNLLHAESLEQMPSQPDTPSDKTDDIAYSEDPDFWKPRPHHAQPAYHRLKMLEKKEGEASRPAFDILEEIARENIKILADNRKTITEMKDRAHENMAEIIGLRQRKQNKDTKTNIRIQQLAIEMNFRGGILHKVQTNEKKKKEEFYSAVSDIGLAVEPEILDVMINMEMQKLRKSESSGQATR